MRKRRELAEGMTIHDPRKGTSGSIPGPVAGGGGLGSDGRGGVDGPKEEFRCCCGSLMVRRRGDVIELECRRCRRCHHLRIQPGGEVVVTEAPPSSVTEEEHDHKQR